MAFHYDVSVLELLDILGCQPNPDYSPDPRVPALLNDFLSRVLEHPLFETADIWTCPEPCSQDAAERYLKIGSDYAAGVVEFGIREADLDQPDPPVYILHEGDPTGWRQLCPDLTSYLKYVLCAILCCETYETGMEVLEEEGWCFEECEPPEDAPMTACLSDLAMCCGYDPDTHTILAILSSPQCTAFQITKED